MKSIALNMDCMEYMRTIPDKHFDLVIADPPYGIGNKFKGGKNGKMNFNEIVVKDWDTPPDYVFFNEIFRISKNQIIWGGNYFALPPSRCYIVWDKLISFDFSLAMAELAWTSYDKLIKIIKLSTPKTIKKIHPTQKPVKLYEWILKHYAKAGDKIFDPMFGSGSSRIACHKHGFEWTGCELDKHYFDLQEKRFKEYIDKKTLF